MEKAYKKLSEDQFRRVIKTLPEYRKEAAELKALMKAATPEKLREVLGDGIWWAPLYEFSLVEILAFMIIALGDTERVKEWAQSPDPQESLLEHLENLTVGDWKDGPGQRISMAEFIALVTAVQRNILSIMIYKRTLSGLVADAREGDDNALFDAIRIDRTVASCPSIAARISRAELTSEKNFFLRLIRAYKGPSRKHWEGYQDLRYSLVLLRDMGCDGLSDAELEHLLVDVLKVYPKSLNARKNLRKQYYESKKIKSL